MSKNDPLKKIDSQIRSYEKKIDKLYEKKKKLTLIGFKIQNDNR